MPVTDVFSPCLDDPAMIPRSVGRAELPKAVLKHLRPLGHEVVLFSAAIRQMLTRLEKGRFQPELTHFLQRWLPAGGLPQQVEEPFFNLVLKESRSGWQVSGSSLRWLNAPIWSAMLHLPALRPFWASELRGSHLEHLRQILPAAWCLDGTPLPPGSVIAGLGIASWAELVRYRPQGREWLIHGSSTALTSLLPEERWLQELQQAVQKGGEVLVEAPSGPGAMLARYQSGADGIQLAAVWACEAGEVRQVL